MSEQRISEAAVEAMAKCQYLKHHAEMEFGPGITWGSESERYREGWRHEARLDLETAYPHLREAILGEVREALIGENALLAWQGAALTMTRESLARALDSLSNTGEER